MKGHGPSEEHGKRRGERRDRKAGRGEILNCKRAGGADEDQGLRGKGVLPSSGSEFPACDQHAGQENQRPIGPQPDREFSELEFFQNPLNEHRNCGTPAVPGVKQNVFHHRDGVGDEEGDKERNPGTVRDCERPDPISPGLLSEEDPERQQDKNMLDSQAAAEQHEGISRKLARVVFFDFSPGIPPVAQCRERHDQRLGVPVVARDDHGCRAE